MPVTCTVCREGGRDTGKRNELIRIQPSIIITLTVRIQLTDAEGRTEADGCNDRAENLILYGTIVFAERVT